MSDHPMKRRDFVKASSAAAAGVFAANMGLLGREARADGGSGEIRVGLIGCGGRGTGAAVNSVNSAEGVTIVALGDVFMSKVQQTRSRLQQAIGDKLAVTDEACFDGLDAYRKVIRHPDVDVVIMATPPGFRPQHLAETVAARKHAFIEKPCCVDPAGYRSILESARIAREQGTAIVTGTQFRRSNNYVEAVKAIHEGAIGDILFAQARYCSGGIWYRPRTPEMTDAEYQINNWYHFVWVCGDQIVEQAVHNLDAINWVMGGPPARAFGSGGQRSRPADSEIYDCMSIDYEYPNGATLSFMCRQQEGKSEVMNRIVGTRGEAWILPFGTSMITKHDGTELLRVQYQPDAYTIEHTHLIESIRRGEPIVEAEELADSSLTAVLGRMAAYTGAEVPWEFAASESTLDLMPPDLTLSSSLPSPGVAKPGTTKLV
ncbi:MAG: Gfo/Idh/MocA family protein [Planctomycetota bacterium]|jgi:predicted dehydrogenase